MQQQLYTQQTNRYTCTKTYSVLVGSLFFLRLPPYIVAKTAHSTCAYHLRRRREAEEEEEELMPSRQAAVARMQCQARASCMTRKVECKSEQRAPRCAFVSPPGVHVRCIRAAAMTRRL